MATAPGASSPMKKPSGPSGQGGQNIQVFVRVRYPLSWALNLFTLHDVRFCDMKEFQPNNLQIIHILEYGRIYFYTNLFSPLLQKSFFRPLNSTEKNSRSWSVLDTPGTREVVVKEKSNSSLTKTFNFDRVFGTNSAQQDVYKSVVGPLIKQVLQGIHNKVMSAFVLLSWALQFRQSQKVLLQLFYHSPGM